MLAEVMSYNEEAASGSRVRQRTVHWAVLTGALATLALLAAILWAYPYVPPVTRGRGPHVRGVDRLVSLRTERRFLDARVSGGFSWAPLQPFERSDTDARSTSSWEVLAAASAIRNEAELKPTTESLHALGIAHFVLGDLDDAVSVLRRVTKESAGDAKSLNDLGAALLERGETKGRPGDLVEALSWINKSLELNPSFAEAMFNRAIALEKLHLDTRAVAAWETYLEKTAEPGWTEEARRRLERLKAPGDSSIWRREKERIESAVSGGDPKLVDTIVAAWVQETRTWVEDGLMGDWAQAAAAGRRQESERALSTAETLANALFSRTGDPMTRDEVAFVRAVVSELEPSGRLPATIRGRAALRAGNERYTRFEIEDAYPSFEVARSTLSSIADPVALSASLASARCEYYRGALDRAAQRLDEILPVAERRGYLTLTAQVHALKGLLGAVGGRYDESISDYRRALSIFRRLGEEENVAFTSSLLAETVGSLGDEHESLRLDLEAISRLGRVSVSGRTVAILEQTALALTRQGFADVALEFQDLAVERALSDGDPIDAADSLLRHATIACAAGRERLAVRDLDNARTWVAGIQDKGLRRRLAAELAYAEGRLARAGHEPQAAAAVLSEAIDYFKKTGLEARLPTLYLERARAFRAAGDPAHAERDLEDGIRILEAHRKDVLEEDLRVSYFDTAQEMFEELVSLQLSEGRSEAALASLERGKTRDLLDRLSPGQTPDLRDLGDAIPAGVTVVEYGVLRDRLLIWTIGRGARGFAERPIREEDLSSLVSGFREDLERHEDGSGSEAGERLREVLLDPIASRLTGAETIVFVPDDVLHSVPFAALPDSRSGHYLVEACSIIVSPSVAFFVRASRGSASVAPNEAPTLLAVGDPAFDTAAFPYLPRLAMAADEARRVGKLYADALVLVGERATRTSFLEALGNHTVVHYAGHALGNDADPLRSRLLLAPDPDRLDTGTLYAAEIYGRSFESTRLVVLAGCATASGRVSRGEGPLSLARPFLAGGVPAVLATLWDIEDASSSELLVRFHKEIIAGRSPQEALRDAQLAQIDDAEAARRAPRIWAAYELVGGSSPWSNGLRREG